MKRVLTWQLQEIKAASNKRAIVRVFVHHVKSKE